jgi:hypothetical protein
VVENQPKSQTQSVTGAASYVTYPVAETEALVEELDKR